MPMFIFISGFFYTTNNLKDWKKYIWHKVQKLLLPFLGLNVLGVLITYIFYMIYGVKWNGIILQKTFLRDLFVYGTVVDIVSPGWFIVILFEVILTYTVIRLFLKNIWNDKIMLVVLGMGAVFSIYFSRTGQMVHPLNVLWAKILFFLYFFHVGYVFKKYSEKIKESQYLNYYLTVILLSIFINLGILKYYSLDDMRYVSLAFFSTFQTDNYLLPIITAMSGILFYWGICGIISPVFGNSKFVNYISSNTIYILSFHLLCFNLINLFLVELKGIKPLLFLESAWFVYDDGAVVRIIYMIGGVLGAILIKNGKEKCVCVLHYIKMRFNNVF